MDIICSILCNDGSQTAQTDVSNLDMSKLVMTWLDFKKGRPRIGFNCE